MRPRERRKDEQIPNPPLPPTPVPMMLKKKMQKILVGNNLMGEDRNFVTFTISQNRTELLMLLAIESGLEVLIKEEIW